MTNPGTTNLISWWAMNEASGSAIDSHGTNHLAETSGTIASVAGKVNNARDFELADSKYFTIASNATLQSGTNGLTIGCWAKFESLGSTAQYIMAKAKSGTTSCEYRLHTPEPSGNTIQFDVSTNGTTITYGSTSAGTMSTGVWYFIMAWWDKTAQKIYSSINNGTPAEAAFTGDIWQGTNSFTIGASNTPDKYTDAIIDEAFLYKKTLTADERTWLYNSGNGRSYSDLTASESSLLTPMWFV